MTAGNGDGPGYKRLAAALIRSAREALGMDHSEFAAYLGSVLGWKVMPEVVGRWEEGASSPGDVVLACGDVVRKAVAITPGLPLSADARTALALLAPALADLEQAADDSPPGHDPDECQAERDDECE